DTEGMVAEGKRFAKIAKNIAIKVPLTWDGMKACRQLSNAGLMVNVTLCFSPVQAMMAAKAGASFISPFIGRLDDIGQDGMALIHEIRTIYDNYDFKTQILAASIRGVPHVRNAALAGADIATIPPDVFKSLLNHPLPTRDLRRFSQTPRKPACGFARNERSGDSRRACPCGRRCGESLYPDASRPAGSRWRVAGSFAARTGGPWRGAGSSAVHHREVGGGKRGAESRARGTSRTTKCKCASRRRCSPFCPRSHRCAQFRRSDFAHARGGSGVRCRPCGHLCRGRWRGVADEDRRRAPHS